MVDTAFPPVVGDDPRVLVLGSMPGAVSLGEQQYYAHPRNAFWPVMASLGLPVLDSAGVRRPYAERLQALRDHHIALWDVIHRCERPGSLDSAIVHDSVEANDFATFFRAHPGIQLVVFNGGSVEQLFRRHVLPVVNREALPAMMRLPSTSPANAGMPVAAKIAAWAVIKPYV